MEENEKQEDIRDKVCLDIQFLDDDDYLIIQDYSTDSLIAKLSFYEHDLTKSEKAVIGNVLLSEIAETIYNRKELRKQRSWNVRSEAFKEAIKHENKEDKQAICWLMTTILEITGEEASRRYDILKGLREIKTFKESEEEIIDKVYLNDSHLKDCELGDVELINARGM